MRLTVGELKAPLAMVPDDVNVVMEYRERTANIEMDGYCSPLNQFVLRNVPKHIDALGYEMTLTRWYSET